MTATLRDALVVSARYHAWANDRVFEGAASVGEPELRAPASLDHGTAWDTLRHLVDVDWSWRRFCLGEDVGEAYVWDLEGPLDDLPTLRTFSREDDAVLRTYVASLDDAALAEELRITDAFSRPRWLILAHLLNHGTQHRTEMARFLTDRGHSPGDLDLLDALEMP